MFKDKTIVPTLAYNSLVFIIVSLVLENNKNSTYFALNRPNAQIPQK